jgi:hypothetical protein
LSATPIRDVLLPASDRVAAVQVGVVIVLALATTWLVRRERAIVLLTAGITLFVLGLMALRTLH